jgi:deazaflavin-dependent oxidoreductase (nitroreductase family)
MPLNPKDEVAKLVNAYHRTVFRATGGRVFGSLMGMPVVLLTTTGRTSGKERETMLTSPVQDGDNVVLVASYGGDSRHPQWYRNLEANSECEIVFRGRTRRMRARTASSEERAELWPRVVAGYRGYADYQKRTDREIPLVILEPLPASA